MFRWHHLLLLLVFAPASVVEAAVTVNEVAWMGDIVSANHEWIELYNSGDAAVSLEGWTLTDGMNLSIALTGTIAPRAYAVLERTSEESAAGTAFLIYTGALVNTGATLTLTDAAGVTMDQVPGGEGWQSIGGDNTTKDTAQYKTSGWITAPGTPGKANAATQTASPAPVSNPNPPAASVSSGGSSAPSKSTPTVTLTHTPSELVTAIRGPSRVYVNESVEFTLSALGAGPAIVASLVHAWNFGDTYTATGTTVSHRFEYPGMYLVTVRSRFAKHDTVARFEVTVLPVTVSLGETEAGDITLNNDASYEVDVSGYTVRGDTAVVLPPGTVLLPRGTITLSGKRLKAPGSTRPVMVYDTALVPVTSTYETLVAEVFSPTAIEETSGVLREEAFVPPPTYPVVVDTETALLPEVPRYVAAPAVVTERSEELSLPQERPVRWPYAAWLIVVALCIGIIFLSPRSTPDTGSTRS